MAVYMNRVSKGVHGLAGHNFINSSERYNCGKMALPSLRLRR